MSKWYSLLFQRYLSFQDGYCNLDVARIVTVNNHTPVCMRHFSSLRSGESVVNPLCDHDSNGH